MFLARCGGEGPVLHTSGRVASAYDRGRSLSVDSCRVAIVQNCRVISRPLFLKRTTAQMIVVVSSVIEDCRVLSRSILDLCATLGGDEVGSGLSVTVARAGCPASLQSPRPGLNPTGALPFCHHV
jgi:hypothetical protein